MSNLISKRFVIRQSLVGKNVTIEFTNKKGKTVHCIITTKLSTL